MSRESGPLRTCATSAPTSTSPRSSTSPAPGATSPRPKGASARPPARVAATAVPFAEGLEAGGVAATAKHFPGSAARRLNTDVAVQRVGLSKAVAAERRRGALPGFVAAGGEMVMLSTAVYPAFSGRPAAFARADRDRRAAQPPRLRGGLDHRCAGDRRGRRLRRPGEGRGRRRPRRHRPPPLRRTPGRPPRAARRCCSGLRSGSMRREDFEASAGASCVCATSSPDCHQADDRGESSPYCCGNRDPVVTVEELLSSARVDLDRLTPAKALAESEGGAALVDIRPAEQRDRDGSLPGARVVSRNVLEWRLDPQCDHRDEDLARLGRRIILICDQGYQSSLVAATARRFGLDATDVIGGVQSWLGEGLPIERSSEEELLGGARGPVATHRLGGTSAAQRLPEVEGGEAAVGAPGLADLEHLLSGSASPPGRTRSGPPCGCRGRRRRGRRAVRGGRSGTSPRSTGRARGRRRSPRSPPRRRARRGGPAPARREITWAARSRMYSTLRPESPAARRSSSLASSSCSGDGVAPSKRSSTRQVDRPRRFGRELLADDRPQQRPVGVGRALLAAPPQPRREVDLADPLDQRPHRRVGGGERFRSVGAHRPCPLGLALLGEGGDPLAEVLGGEAGLAQRDQAGLLRSLRTGLCVERLDRASCCRASRAARWRRSRRPARPTLRSSSLVGDDLVDEADLLGARRLEVAAGEEQLLGPRQADRVEELAQPGVAVDEPELGRRHPQLRARRRRSAGRS